MPKNPDPDTLAALEAIKTSAEALPSNERRRFLLKALTAGTSAFVGTAFAGLPAARGAELPSASATQYPPGVPSWSKRLGAGVASTPYGMPVKYEHDVIRRIVPWLAQTRQASVSFTPLQDLHGTITPNGLFFERYHAGKPIINPAEHRLMIHGMVDRPLMLTMDDIMRYPAVSRVHFVECAANGAMEWHQAQLDSLQYTHGMLACCEWTGVKLSTLLDQVGVDKKASWILVEGADGAKMTRSVPLWKAMDDCIVVYAQNGEALRAEQGFPLRILVPGFEGNMNVKWLRRIKVGDQPWYTREETSEYTELLPDGQAKAFDFYEDAKSVITFPCPEKPPQHGKSTYEIHGLAWSGRGKIKHVDVSFDGGANWRRAQLQAPILSKSLTRFRIPWQWDGGKALLASRATDETGYVQPTIVQLAKVRGRRSVYHNNSIQVWQVTPEGKVHNVQLG